MSQPPQVLAGVRLSDLALGPCTVTDYGDTRKYMENSSGHPLRVVVIGVVTGVLDIGNGERTVVLSAPTEDSRIIRVMFDEQLQILDSVLVNERMDTKPVILLREHWSQGPSSLGEGTIFIRIRPDCALGCIDFSTQMTMFPLEGGWHEIPVTDADVPVMEIGALMLYTAWMYRCDQLQTASANYPLYRRSYILEASHGVRWIRSSTQFQLQEELKPSTSEGGVGLPLQD